MYIWYIHDTRYTVYGIYGAQFILFRSFELRAKPSRVNEPANNRQQNLEKASSTSIPTVTVMRTHVIYIRLMLYNIMYIHMSIKRVFTMLYVYACGGNERIKVAFRVNIIHPITNRADYTGWSKKRTSVVLRHSRPECNNEMFIRIFKLYV